MKKTAWILVTVLMVVLALSIPAQAGEKIAAGGLWRYTPYILDVRIAGGNTFVHTHEDGVWTGTFEGLSTEDGHLVIHSSSGFRSFRATVTFSQVTVDGKSGTLEMSAVGKELSPGQGWEGRWVITGGTGDLASLRGQGTWWGPGAPAPGVQGDIYYAGEIHFEP
jgi:hypothetical protein